MTKIQSKGTAGYFMYIRSVLQLQVPFLYPAYPSAYQAYSPADDSRQHEDTSTSAAQSIADIAVLSQPRSLSHPVYTPMY